MAEDPFPAAPFFLAALVCSRSLTTNLVDCNMCYGGSFIAVSCNSLSLNETCAKAYSLEK